MKQLLSKMAFMINYEFIDMISSIVRSHSGFDQTIIDFLQHFDSDIVSIHFTSKHQYKINMRQANQMFQVKVIHILYDKENEVQKIFFIENQSNKVKNVGIILVSHNYDIIQKYLHYSQERENVKKGLMYDE